MKAGGEVDKEAGASTDEAQKYRKLIDRHNKHRESNSIATSNNHANLHSNHAVRIPNADYTLLTVQ